MIKKIGGVLLALFLAISLTVPAWAATEPVVLPPKDDGKTYSFTQSGYSPGDQCLLLIVRKGVDLDNLSLEDFSKDILYIDQTAADADGNAVFDSFQLKSNVSADVYVTTNSTDAGAPSGYVARIEVAGASTSGKIVFHNAYSTATVTLINSDSTEEAGQFETEKDGSYVVEGISPGTYDIQVMKLGYAKVTKRNCTIETDVPIPDISITGYAGDVNGSGKIDSRDLNSLLVNFNKKVDETSAQSRKASDINGSGTVNSTDLNLLLKCFNKGTSGGVILN